MTTRNRRRLRRGIIGGAVGLATVGAIVVVATKKAEPDRPAFEMPVEPTTLRGEPMEAGGASGRVATTPLAADKKEADTKTKRGDAGGPPDRVAATPRAADERLLAAKAANKAKRGGAFAELTASGDIPAGGYDKNVYGDLLENEAREVIGHGTIGIVEIGSPSVVPTSAADPGILDAAIVRRHIERSIPQLQSCYENELVKKQIAGTVNTRFTILESGAVGTANASGVDPTVSNCVAAVVKGIEFPNPKGTGGVTVTYPFMFRPA